MRKSIVFCVLLCSISVVSCVSGPGVKTDSLMSRVELRSQKESELPFKVSFLGSIGKVGTGEGEFFRPTAVDVDSDGNIYVLDSGTERVQLFNTGREFLYEFDIADSGKENKAELMGIAVYRKYRVYVSDRQNNTVSVYEIEGRMSEGETMQSVNFLGALENKGGEKLLSELEVGNIFNFANGSPSGTYEVKDLGTDNLGAEDTDSFEWKDFDFATYGSQDVYLRIKLDHPVGMTVDKLGNVYLANSYTESIMVFDSYNKYSFSFGTFGRGMNQFKSPSDVAVDYERNIYVADTGNNRIQMLDFNGNYLAEWGGKGEEDGQFLEPSAVAVDGVGNVYVADTGNGRIQVFDKNGKFLFKFKSMIPGTEEKFKPVSVAISEEGHLYVLDSLNNTLTQYLIGYRE